MASGTDAWNSGDNRKSTTCCAPAGFFAPASTPAYSTCRKQVSSSADVVGSELVGLMPAGAAAAAAGALLRIDGFDASRVLEVRLLGD
jgi:hypothetical protein